MNRYEQLITNWTEAMHAKLEIHKEQAEKATRADYHKGMADGMVTGLSYAMAVLIQMERRTISNAIASVEMPKEAPVALLSAKDTKTYTIAPASQEEPKEPVIKRVIAFRCEHCGDEAVTFTDPTKPILCNKCQTVHHFAELHRASYFCECGKICKFMMESAVVHVKCHCCKKHHRMAFSRVNNEFYSLDNRDREGYTAKTQSTIKKPVGQKTEFKPRPTKFKKPQEKRPFHISTCLECEEEFMTHIEGCVTCDKCAGGNK